MVQFSQEPRSDLHAGTLRVVRVGSDRPIKGIITSEVWTGCDTHFAGGRTIPCEGLSCSICLSGTHPRWHAYFALLMNPTQEHVLMCLPLSAFHSLKTYHAEWGTIRGAMLVAHRPSKRANGRVLTSLDHAGRAPGQLPAAPQVEAILLRMWQATPHLRSAHPSRNGRNRIPSAAPPNGAAAH